MTSNINSINNNQIIINEFIESIVIDNILNNMNQNISNLLSRRYYNTPPLGGYIISDDSDSEYSEYSEYYFTDDLRSTVFLESIQDINNNKNNNKNLSLGRYKKVKESNVSLLESQCPICIELFKKNECYRVLSCNHTFHKKCIDRWIKKDKNECPMCRKNIFSLN